MHIKNGLVLNENFEFEKTSIEFSDRIISFGSENTDENVFDAEGLYVVPGLVDTHIHSSLGETFIDFTETTAEKVCSFQAKNGTTSILPTLSAAREEKMINAVKYITEKAKTLPENCAKIQGLHLEGPFFAQKYKGAHLPENIRIPTVAEFDRLYDASCGAVKIITMAPELENGIEVVKHADKLGVKVSVGHSDADFETAMLAFSSGASRSTHTFNAMSPLNHRKPGVVGAAMSDKNVTCELICDFFHVHPSVVKLLFDIKGSDKITAVTDAEVGTGMKDGEYLVNGRMLKVEDGKTYTEDGTIAGGTSVLLDGVKNLVSIGISLENAVKCASFNGAKAACLENSIGSLKVGKCADILVLDKNLDVVKVFVDGKSVL